MGAKSYNVYHHDYLGNESVNTKSGYHVTLSTTEGFRDIPITSLIWSETVKASNKEQAISEPISQRRERAKL